MDQTVTPVYYYYTATYLKKIFQLLASNEKKQQFLSAFFFTMCSLNLFLGKPQSSILTVSE